QSEDEVLKLAASLERGSEHPLASAIVGAAEKKRLELEIVEAFESKTGKGVNGRAGGRAIALGNVALFEELAIDPAPLVEAAEAQRKIGETVVLIAIDGAPAGIIGVSDPVKPSAPRAIAQLHAAGIQIAMVSGDSRTTAEQVA